VTDDVREDSYLKLGGRKAKHWLMIDTSHHHRFALASDMITLFQHQVNREISRISDKLTVSTLASLHFILKLHSYGFTRESLHRMSEALNVHRSPELNTIIDDLLTHVLKSYIRRIRNGAYRYRFNSSFEQELRHISQYSDLESASHNFSLVVRWIHARELSHRYIYKKLIVVDGQSSCAFDVFNVFRSLRYRLSEEAYVFAKYCRAPASEKQCNDILKHAYHISMIPLFCTSVHTLHVQKKSRFGLPEYDTNILHTMETVI